MDLRAWSRFLQVGSASGGCASSERAAAGSVAGAWVELRFARLVRQAMRSFRTSSLAVSQLPPSDQGYDAESGKPCQPDRSTPKNQIMKLATTTTAIITVLLLTVSTLAQTVIPVRAPKEALLFKSGQSYLYREAQPKPGEHDVRLRLPPGIHGTIWLESDTAKIAWTRAKRLGRVNAARTLLWEFELGAGKEWKAEYSYRVFIHR